MTFSSATIGRVTPSIIWKFNHRGHVILRLHVIRVALACTGLVPALAMAAPEPSIIEWGDLGVHEGQFDMPVGVAVGGTHVYVTDFGNNRIQKFTRDGAYVSQWGTPGSAAGEFRGPCGIAVDARGEVYVTDFYNHRVQKFTPEGELLAQWGAEGSDAALFRGPAAIAIDGSGCVMVTDLDGRRIQKFTADGTLVQAWDAGEGGALSGPWGIAAGSDGGVYVVDRTGDRVHRFDGSGRWISSFGGHGRGTGAFRGPVGVAVSARGQVFVTDLANQRVQRFSAEGTYVSDVGGDAVAGGVHGLAVADGDLYVTDIRNHRVLRLVGAAAGSAEAARPIEAFALTLAGPNPSSTGTTLRFAVPAGGRVQLEVLDLAGRRVRTLADGTFAPGYHTQSWDGRSDSRQRMAAGVYFVLGRFDDGGHVRRVQRRVVVVP